MKKRYILLIALLVASFSTFLINNYISSKTVNVNSDYINENINSNVLNIDNSNSNTIINTIESEEAVIITDDYLKSDIANSDKPTLLYFYANWCELCNEMSPIMDKIIKSNDNINIIKINTDENEDLLDLYKIEEIPQLVLYIDGKEADRFLFPVNQEAVKEFFSKNNVDIKIN